MDGCPEKFPILDFYLNNCKNIPVQGVVKTDLQLMDVGKLDSLHDADAFCRGLNKITDGYSLYNNNTMQQKIIILDFGSQTTQLIGRRVRELDTFCEFCLTISFLRTIPM